MSAAPLIYKKIVSVMKDLNAVGKDHNNNQQNFKYRSIDDTINELHPHMVDAGIFVSPEIIEERREERPSKSGGVITSCILKIKYSFFAEDGSFITAITVGEGMDSGDKASGKAQSFALKTALTQVFAIPTKEPKDPDAESYEPMAKEPAVAKLNPPPKKANVLPSTEMTFENYVIPFGKFKNQKLTDITVYEIEGYRRAIERKAFEEKREITGQAAVFIRYADEYIEARSVKKAQKEMDNEFDRHMEDDNYP